MNRFFAAVAVLAFACVAQAQSYKWVDKDGKVQYGDAPPQGATKVTPLKPPAGPAAQPASKDAKDAKDAKKLSPEEAFKKRQADQKAAEEKAAKADKEAADRRQQCASHQDAIRQLESGARIARTNEKGERYFVEDDQRAKEIAQQRKFAAEACK
jgi:hypothetical protein